MISICADGHVAFLQIEQHAQVRAALPTPQQGELPLPEGLPKAMLECNPQAVEDLNAVVPKDSHQLSTQELNEHVSACPACVYGALCTE